MINILQNYYYMQESIPCPVIPAYHSQQCAENNLKAYLLENEIEFPRTHQWMVLIELCTGIEPSFMEIIQLCQRLKGYAVAARCPGILISVGAAEKALQTTGIIRDFIRNKFYQSS